jgi:hypothetical protein
MSTACQEALALGDRRAALCSVRIVNNSHGMASGSRRHLIISSERVLFVHNDQDTHVSAFDCSACKTVKSSVSKRPVVVLTFSVSLMSSLHRWRRALGITLDDKKLHAHLSTQELVEIIFNNNSRRRPYQTSAQLSTQCAVQSV